MTPEALDFDIGVGCLATPQPTHRERRRGGAGGPAITHTIEYKADGTCVLLDHRGNVLHRGTLAECEAIKDQRYAEDDRRRGLKGEAA